MSLGQYWLEVAVLVVIGFVGCLTLFPLYYTSAGFGVKIAAAASDADVDDIDDDAALVSVASTMFGLVVSFLFSAIVGLIAAHAVGLGAPFLEARIEGIEGALDTSAYMPVLIRSVEIGVGLGILGLVFNAITKFSKGNAGLWALGQLAPFWQRLLAIIGASTVSVVIIMSGISILTWLLGLIWHEPDKTPLNLVYWVAIGFIALIYSIQQTFQLAQLRQFLQVTWFTIVLAFIASGISSVVIGYVLWHNGLEAGCVVCFVSTSITTLLGR